VTRPALNWSEKFRRFVILVSIRSGWIHLSTLSSFAGPLHIGVTIKSERAIGALATPTSVQIANIRAVDVGALKPCLCQNILQQN
jgi:hypothetical protein